MFKKPQVSLERQCDCKPLEEQKRDILENFNFALVASIMAIPCRPVYRWDIADNPNIDDFNDIVGYKPWKMYVRTNEYKVPNEEELRFIANELLNNVIKYAKSGDHSIATGPFKATYRYGILELYFIMESWGMC